MSRAALQHFPEYSPSNLAIVRVLPERDMRIRGIVRTATLEENPPGSDRIEMVLRAQGVGPDQPRTFVVPYELLLADPQLDPDTIRAKRFEAEVEESEPGRWVVSGIAFATGQFLRKPEEP